MGEILLATILIPVYLPMYALVLVFDALWSLGFPSYVNVLIVMFAPVIAINVVGEIYEKLRVYWTMKGTS
jgi:hypothetical protein